MMKNPRGFRSGQSGNLTCDMFGGLKNFVGDGLVMLFGIKYPPHWKFRICFLFYREI